MDSNTDWLEKKLSEGLVEPQITIKDESHRHRGHAGAQQGGHYDVSVISQSFSGLNRLERHRLIYQIVDERMGAGIHALSLKLQTPEEAL